jgi:L-asparaginase II
MANPVLVEVTRGPVVESRHRGAVAICDAAGRLVFAAGDIGQPVFPRSTVKALQQLPLIETGGADRFGFGDAELALSISSHKGEARHVATARAMLAAAGLGEGCLECGPQWPAHGRDQAVLNRMGARASRIHNNCSGKHAGFLCTAVAMGVDPAGYVRADHPLMREVAAAVEAMTGAGHGVDTCGIDGCSIPTYAIPLAALARGFARFAGGEGLAPARAAAAARLRAAAAAEPFLVSGTGGFDTAARRLLGPEAFVKTGAEGVYVAALPGSGLGIALKIDDGATRAAEVAMAAVLRQRLALGDDDPRASGLDALVRPTVTDRNGRVVGEVRPGDDLVALLAGRRRG